VAIAVLSKVNSEEVKADSGKTLSAPVAHRFAELLIGHLVSPSPTGNILPEDDSSRLRDQLNALIDLFLSGDVRCSTSSHGTNTYFPGAKKGEDDLFELLNAAKGHPSTLHNEPIAAIVNLCQQGSFKKAIEWIFEEFKSPKSLPVSEAEQSEQDNCIAFAHVVLGSTQLEKEPAAAWNKHLTHCMLRSSCRRTKVHYPCANHLCNSCWETLMPF